MTTGAPGARFNPPCRAGSYGVTTEHNQVANNVIIKHKRLCLFSNTEKSVENVMHNEVSLKTFEELGNAVKHSLEFLIKLVNQN